MQYQKDNKDGRRMCHIQPSCIINKYKQAISMHAKTDDISKTCMP